MIINWRNPIIQSGLFILGLWLGGSLAYVLAETSDNMIDNDNWTSTGNVRIGIPNDPSAITFSYTTGTVTQNIDPYEHIPAGNIIDEITWDYEYKKYDNAVGCYSNCVDDSLTESVKLTDEDGNITTPWSWTGNISNTEYIANPTQTFTQPNAWADGADLTNIEIFFSGKDEGFWAGYYGPTLRNFELIAEYSEDSSYYDPIEESIENGVCDSSSYNDPDCDDYSIDDCDDIYDPGCIEDENTSYTGMSIDEFQILGIEEQFGMAEFDGTFEDFEIGIEEGIISETGVDTTMDEPYDENMGGPINEEMNNGEEPMDEMQMVNTPLNSPLPIGITNVPSNTMVVRRAINSRSFKFLNSIGAGSIGNYNGITPMGVVSLNIPGLNNVNQANILNISQAQSNLSNRNLNNSQSDGESSDDSQSTNYGNDQDSGALGSDDTLEEVDIALNEIDTSNPLWQQGLEEAVSIADMGGLNINDFKQPNLQDNPNWYAEDNLLEQQDIYTDQLFYKVQDIYTNSNWYK